MKFTELALPGVWLIEPEPFSDERGVFYRLFCAQEFAAHGLIPIAVQGNISVNPYLGTWFPLPGAAVRGSKNHLLRDGFDLRHCCRP